MHGRGLEGQVSDGPYRSNEARAWSVARGLEGELRRLRRRRARLGTLVTVLLAGAAAVTAVGFAALLVHVLLGR